MNRRKAIQNVSYFLGGFLSFPFLLDFFNSCNQTGSNGDQSKIGENDSLNASSSLRDFSGGLLSSEQKQLIEEIADTILPITQEAGNRCPGAKEAGVGAFIQLMIHDCYPKKDQELMINGLTQFQTNCKTTMGQSFLTLGTEERVKYLMSIEKDLFKQNSSSSQKISDDHSQVNKKSSKQGSEEAVIKSAEANKKSEWIDAVNKKPEKEIEEPNHYYKILKELTLLGYFTSKSGATIALEYVKVPGKYTGSMPMQPNQKAWATS